MLTFGFEPVTLSYCQLGAFIYQLSYSGNLVLMIVDNRPDPQDESRYKPEGLKGGGMFTFGKVKVIMRTV